MNKVAQDGAARSQVLHELQPTLSGSFILQTGGLGLRLAGGPDLICCLSPPPPVLSSAFLFFPPDIPTGVFLPEGDGNRTWHQSSLAEGQPDHLSVRADSITFSFQRADDSVCLHVHLLFPLV